jgi:plastocyanin
MTTTRTMAMLLGALLVAVAACGDGGTADEGTGLQPSERYVSVQATEFDTRRTLEQNSFPQQTIDEWPEYFGEDGTGGSGGYYLFMSGDEEWRIGSYVFLPSEMTFIQGDRVTMEVFGVRGSSHENILVGPDGFEPIQFTVNRGELASIEFTVDRPGLYQIFCMSHQPSMTANIHVLPAG